MSPSALKLFFASGLSMLAGGVLGGLVTRAVYGGTVEQIDPLPPREKKCPICPVCATCPPIPDCAQEKPPDTATSTSSHALLMPESEEPEQHRRAGLPASAIQLATSSVRQSFGPCFDEAIRIDARGTVLLELTVTATGGQGFISDASVVKRSDDARASSSIESCMIESAMKTRFDVSADDGEARLALPIKIRKD